MVTSRAGFLAFATLAIVACYRPASSSVDAAAGADASADATADASLACPPSQPPVTIAIYGDSGDPVTWGRFSGVRVYVQDTATSAARVVTTDADGNATACVAPGGFVTAENPLWTTPIFDTWAGVQPGDHLVLTNAPDPPPTPITFTLPPDSGATSYFVQTSCGGGTSSGPSAAIPLSACPALIDVAVVTSATGTDRKSFVAHDAPFNGTGPIDLSSMTYAPFAPVTRHITITGGVVPAAGGGSVSTTAWNVAGLRDRATLDPIFVNSGNPFVADQTLRYALSGNGLLVTTNFDAQPTDGTAHLLHALVWTRAAQADPVTIDLTPIEPPWIVMPTYDPASRRVTWTTSGAGPAANYALVDLVVARTTTTAVGWEVVGPLAADGIDLPVFPTGDATTIEVEAATAHADTDGWDAARARLLSPAIDRSYQSPSGSDVSVEAEGIAGM